MELKLSMIHSSNSARLGGIRCKMSMKINDQWLLKRIDIELKGTIECLYEMIIALINGKETDDSFFCCGSCGYEACSDIFWDTTMKGNTILIKMEYPIDVPLGEYNYSITLKELINSIIPLYDKVIDFKSNNKRVRFNDGPFNKYLKMRSDLIEIMKDEKF
jgi:hypothetical protein